MFMVRGRLVMDKVSLDGTNGPKGIAMVKASLGKAQVCLAVKVCLVTRRS